MNLLNIQNTFTKYIRPIFFISPVLSRALGLEKILPNFYLITVQKDPLIKTLRENGVQVFCLEEVDNEKPRNSFEILSHPKVAAFIKQKSLGLTPNIITFRSLPQIQKYCENHKYKYLQSDPLLVRSLEDKVFFYKLLFRNGIKVPKSQVKTLETCKFEGQKMVLQLRRGFAGNSTFLIKNANELENFKTQYGKHQVKLTNFIEGRTLTVNGCITDSSRQVGSIFLQIEGDNRLNKNILGTCGNSHFTDDIFTIDIKEKAYKLIDKISKLIYEKGFRGFFGLDLLLSNQGDIIPIEINPRLTASVGNYTQMEISNHSIPLLLHHILYFLNYKISDNEKFIVDDKKYSFLIFRNTSDSKITIKQQIKTGIYALQDNKIIFKKTSLDFTECQEDEFLILHKPENSQIDINKEYAFLLTRERLFQNNKFNELGEKIISILKY